MDASRNGNFTSSEIVALTKDPTAKAMATGQIFGAAGLTYIEECNMERRLGRCIEDETNARNLSWGKLGERYVSENPELLGLEYSVNLSDTTRHPEIEYWLGSEDATKEDTVCDIKCPKTLKSFCQLVDPYVENGKVIYEGLTIEAVRANHKEGDKYYFQLVSNAIIHDKAFGELIIFCPFKSELQKLRDLAQNWDGADQYKYSWIYNASDEEMPYLIDGGFYKNINVIRFEIPQADKDFLTKRVKEAGKLLTPVTHPLAV
jgi:hypothetical protein